MVERFNAVVRRGNIDLEAWFNDRTEANRSWAVEEATWEFPFRYLPAARFRKRRWILPSPLLRARPDLLVSLYAEPSFVLGGLVAHARRIKTAYWVEVTFDAWVPRKWWKEALKRFLFHRLDGVITAGPDGRAFAQRYGARVECIHEARHTIDVGHFVRGSERARTHRDTIRSQHGLSGVTFIYVGRLWSGKGLDYLLRAYADLCRTVPDTSLFLVGDGPEEAHLRRRCDQEGIINVVFAGFHPKEALPALYSAADVFVFPTLGDPYGLVVDEAMACSLPIVATTATGEIDLRVADGKNGFVVAPADAAALQDRMCLLARSPALRGEMGKASRAMIEGNTPERWAEDFERAVGQILAREP
jgi:glycosyltransferase involved in cell wall biosynthesis